MTLAKNTTQDKNHYYFLAVSVVLNFLYIRVIPAEHIRKWVYWPEWWLSVKEHQQLHGRDETFA